MKPLGGELALEMLNEDIYFTDSGRSSLRLFIRSINSDKKILIPNFLCKVIEDILIQEKMNYDFYHVLEDLTIDKTSIVDKEFDIFYSINYFGQINNLEYLNLDEKIVIEDNVFFYDFQNNNNFKYWFAFNSFRKISPLADGSLIKTNLKIHLNQIKHEADFTKIKQKAKYLKYDYLNYSQGNENTYLKLFQHGENLIDLQKNICIISQTSIYHLMQYNESTQQILSKKNYDFLFKELSKYCLNYNVDFYSYFVIKVLKRDELRKFLFSKNIFLPIHWPKSSYDNPLYNKVISIPLFSNYTINDMKYIVKSIKEFYERFE